MPVIPLLLATVLNRAQAEAPSLRVMSFNIRYGTADDGPNRWEVRKARTFAVLRRRRPDVIGLQEALSGQVEDLRRALPGYQALGVGRDDGRGAGEFSAILYDPARLQALRSDTFWLSDTPNVPGSKHWGNGVVRVCTWAYFRDLRTGAYFYHFNTHLDHQSQPSREKGVALILRRILDRLPADPVIVTGDFNVGEENAAAQEMRAAGFRDSFRVLHPDDKAVGTFNGFRPSLGEDKIDYVWVDSRVRVRSAEIVRDKVNGFWISDHVPVIAELWLNH